MLYQESISREAAMILEKVQRDLKRKVERLREELVPADVPMIESDSSDGSGSDDSEADY